MKSDIIEVAITRKTEDGKLIRRRLSGEDAKEWEKWITGIEIFGHVHDYKLLKEFKWEEEIISDWV